MMNETLKTSIKFIMWDILYRLFMFFPQDENKVFYESYLGQSYSDNPKALYEEMLKTGNYKAIWSLKKKTRIPGNAKQVRRLGISYLYHLATAKYIIVNSRMPKEFKKNENQILIQTWHGTPLKKLGHDIKEFTMPNQTAETYLSEFDEDVAKWDYLLSPSAYTTSKLKSAFNYDGEIIECGYPRNDILINSNKQNISLLKNKYDIKSEDRVLLYTPTYRDNCFDDTNSYTQAIKLDLELMTKRLSDWKIILRVHYLIADELNIDLPNVIIPDQSVEISELMLISDCLLTDYSSVMFDYANLNKPIVFYAYDLKEYANETRGFYQDYSKMICGENIKDTNDLIKILKNFTNYRQRYAEQLKLFSEAYCSLDDGQASEKVIRKIMGEK